MTVYSKAPTNWWIVNDFLRMYFKQEKEQISSGHKIAEAVKSVILVEFSSWVRPISRQVDHILLLYLSWQPASVDQLDARPTGDHKVAGSTPAGSATFFRGNLIMKYFLRSFSPFRWFKKGSCQFLAKECAQYWLTA